MVGYYVTMKRDVRTAWLLGPYETHAEALTQVSRGRELAGEIDLFTHFDGFGTSRLEAESLPAGRLGA